MYNDKVLKIFENPRNAGSLPGANGVGKVGNVKCGDIMKIFIKVDEKEGTIYDAKFKTFGCVSAIASTDTACEMIKGKTLEQALKITNKDVIDALGGLPAVKIHCSVLAQEAIAAAVADYKKKVNRAANRAAKSKSTVKTKTTIKTTKVTTKTTSTKKIGM